MNDRFRFRAWYKDLYSYEPRPRMLYDAEQTYDALTGRPEAICEECFGSLLDDEEYIVEQCTGLKDKNGRLIYEGDFLINHDGNIGFIEFKNAGFMLTAINEDNIMSTQDWTECEVIGNIHENADLLEEKSEKPIF